MDCLILAQDLGRLLNEPLSTQPVKIGTAWSRKSRRGSSLGGLYLAGCGKRPPAAFPALPKRLCEAGRLARLVKSAKRAQRLTVRPSVRFASVLAAALLDGLFAHPAWLFTVVSDSNTCHGNRSQNEFFRRLLEDGR